MSLTPLYYSKPVSKRAAQQLFIPMWISSGAIAFLDFALVVAALTVSELLLFFPLAHQHAAWDGAIWFGSTVAILTVIILAGNGLYSRQLQADYPGSALEYPKAFLVAVALAGCLSLFWSVYAITADNLLLLVGVGLLVAWPIRSRVISMLRARIRSGKLATSRAIVLHQTAREGEKDVGADIHGVDIHGALRHGGVEVVYARLLAADEDEVEEPKTLRDLCAAVIRERRPDAIYVALDGISQFDLRRLRDLLCPLPVPIHIIPQARLPTKGAATPAFTLESLFQLQRAPLKRIDLLQKRVFDVLMSALLLMLAAPLLILVSCAIKLDSPGPVLFRQTRRGLHGRHFRILKFRTMTVLENGSEIRQANRDDIRITRLGKLLRQTSIDELPQFLNVLLGDMSLVGPRPHAIAHDDYYSGMIASYAHRQMVKPGVTGWAQVCGYRGATPRVEDMAARVEHDNWYIGNWSFWLDLKIVFRTAVIVFKDSNAY